MLTREGHDCEGMGLFKSKMDTAWRQGLGQPSSNIGVVLEHEPSYYLDRNTQATTSGNYSQAALEATIKEMGKEHILFKNAKVFGIGVGHIHS